MTDRAKLTREQIEGVRHRHNVEDQYLTNEEVTFLCHMALASLEPKAAPQEPTKEVTDKGSTFTPAGAAPMPEPEWLPRYRASARPDHQQCARDYDALRAECERLREDAERYRWMKVNRGVWHAWALAHSARGLDAAIDAARKAKTRA